MSEIKADKASVDPVQQKQTVAVEDKAMDVDDEKKVEQQVPQQVVVAAQKTADEQSQERKSDSKSAKSRKRCRELDSLVDRRSHSQKRIDVREC
jgi:hypothetical protein